MSKIIAGPLNFSLITSEEYPESGSYIIGVDTADGYLKKMDYLGVLTFISPELPSSPTFSSLNLETNFSMGSTISFNHASGSGNTVVDIVDTNVQITRNNSGFLYNPLFESSASGSDPYPTNTEWAYSSEGDDFSTAKTKTYDTLRNTVLNEIGDFISLPGEVLIMHDTANDKYYKVAFTSWQSGSSGGSFSYHRTPLIFDGDASIHFPDGSSLSSGNISAAVNSNIIVVDVSNGNDTTGEAYNISKPFATYTAAVAVAQQYDTIVLMPGNHTIADLLFRNGTVYAYPGVTLTGGKIINDAALAEGESFKLLGHANIVSNDTAIILAGYGDIIIEGERFTTTGSRLLDFQKVSGKSYIKARYFAGLVNSTMYLTGPATDSELVMDIDHFDNITSSGFEMNIYVSSAFAGVVTINAKKITTSPNRNATGSFMAYQNSGNANITINCDEFIDTTSSYAILYQNTGNVTFNAKKVTKAYTLYYSNGGSGLTKIHCGEATLTGQICNNQSGGTSLLLSGSYTSLMNGNYIIYQKGGTTRLKNFDLNITGNSKGFYRDGAGTIIVDDAIICVSNTSINGFESDTAHNIIVNGRAVTNGPIVNLTNSVTGTILVSDPDIRLSL